MRPTIAQDRLFRLLLVLLFALILVCDARPLNIREA
jgi:hypothetical protein